MAFPSIHTLYSSLEQALIFLCLLFLNQSSSNGANSERTPFPWVLEFALCLSDSNS
jgi:hypothetical protein